MCDYSQKKLQAMNDGIEFHTIRAKAQFALAGLPQNEGAIAASAYANVLTHSEQADSLAVRKAELLGQDHQACDPCKSTVGMAERDVRANQQAHLGLARSSTRQQGQSDPAALMPS